MRGLSTRTSTMTATAPTTMASANSPLSSGDGRLEANVIAKSVVITATPVTECFIVSPNRRDVRPLLVDGPVAVVDLLGDRAGDAGADDAAVGFDGRHDA